MECKGKWTHQQLVCVANLDQEVEWLRSVIWFRVYLELLAAVCWLLPFGSVFQVDFMPLFLQRVNSKQRRTTARQQTKSYQWVELKKQQDEQKQRTTLKHMKNHKRLFFSIPNHIIFARDKWESFSAELASFKSHLMEICAEIRKICDK